jgi:hypothetical protein
MADPQVRRFPDVAATGTRATINAALSARRALERALAQLGRERERKVLEKIDGILAKSTFTPADTMKAQLELEALRKTFNDQEAAFRFWEAEASNRLSRLAVDSWSDVLEVLDAQIAALRQRETKEQDEVDEVKAIISEFEALRAELQLKRYPSAGSPPGKGPSPAAPKKSAPA